MAVVLKTATSLSLAKPGLLLLSAMPAPDQLSVIFGGLIIK
jgi:hypothetical protein